MKRYHYSPGDQATESRQLPRWIVPAVLLSVAGGLIAFATHGGRDPIEQSQLRPQSAAGLDGAEGTAAPDEIRGGSDVRMPPGVTGGYRRTFAHCGMMRRQSCVVDGDTFWLDGVKIRVADIDTPEVRHPQCAAEKALADRATRRFMVLLNAGEFELASVGDRDEDLYGRKLRVVLRHGKSLGDQLVGEGLARTWTGRRESWCQTS